MIISFRVNHLSAAELFQLIESSRKSGSITMTDAHKTIRDSFNAG